ncbi:MAG: hypothetical protein ACYDGY_01795, partial [Acidimicrobiales bacterium]
SRRVMVRSWQGRRTKAYWESMLRTRTQPGAKLAVVAEREIAGRCTELAWITGSPSQSPYPLSLL